MGKVKNRREVTYRVWVSPGGIYTPVHIRVAAIVTIPAPIAKKWMKRGVKEVEVKELEDGTLQLRPIVGDASEAVQPILRMVEEKELG
ncbi:MAG: hypothetical protein QXQ60_08015 [Thermofilum sp.]